MSIVIVANKQAPAAKAAEPNLAPVSVIQAQPSTLTPVVTLYGRVVSPSFATLVASVTANVAQVPGRAGQAVEKDQLLVQLEDIEAKLNLAQAQARARDAAAQHELEKQRQISDRSQLKREKELSELANSSFQRAKTLFNKGLIAQAQLDTAREQYERQATALENRELAIRQHKARLETLAAAQQSAKAAVAQAELDVSRTAVSAPFAGLVVDVPVAMGDRVRSGEVLASLYDPTQLEIRALIPNRHLANLRKALASGQQPSASLQTQTTAIDIPLTRLAGAVRSGSGGVDGYFGLPSNTSLELSRSVSLLLHLPATENAIAVPSQAIFGLNAVYLVDAEDRLQRLEVEQLGDYIDNNGEKKVVIRSAQLNANSRILTTQLPAAISGLQVKPILSGDKAQ